MKRVIIASTQMNDTQILHLMGRSAYDQMYKNGCRQIDAEIRNEYGSNVEIDWTNGGATAVKKSDGTYDITHQIYAEFNTARGTRKYCYGEVTSKYNPSNPRDLNTTLDYFTDEVDYE